MIGTSARSRTLSGRWLSHVNVALNLLSNPKNRQLRLFLVERVGLTNEELQNVSIIYISNES